MTPGFGFFLIVHNILNTNWRFCSQKRIAAERTGIRRKKQIPVMSIQSTWHIFGMVHFNRSRVSSVSIVRSPAGANVFSSSLCVQTSFGAHPASCTMGTGGPFPGVKRGRGVTLTTHPI